MASIDAVLAAARIGETSDWEFKSARGGFPGSFWETYSAMANTEGGVIVLGLREAGDDARLDGLTEAQVGAFQKILWDGVNNRAVVSHNLLAQGDASVLPSGAGFLLVVRVPRATRRQRPVYLTPNPIGHTYRRRHEGDYLCGDEDVRRMFADADPLPADAHILEGFELADLDATSLSQYRRRVLAAKGEHPWLALEDRDLLERLGGWRRERDGSGEGLTLAAVLAFGTHGALRDAAPRYFVDYREKLDPTTRWSDRIYPDGTWEPNLFQFYQRVWPRLAAGVSVPFQLEGGIRRDITPAHEALREAFVNALVHADYAEAGGVVVERLTDRFVLENPGTLLVSLDQYRRGGVSECRNPTLQTIFLLFGGGEKAGSGADKIRAGWDSRQWRAPLITAQGEPDRVRLVLTMESLIPEATLRRLRDWLGADFELLQPAEVLALATAELEGAVSNARLQALLRDHPSDITVMLARLCADGRLHSDKRRRWTTYQLGPGPTSSTAGRQLSLGLEGVDPDPSGGSSGRSEANSGHLIDDSGRLDPDSGRLPHLEPSEGDPETLREIAAPVARSGKSAPELMRAVIRDLCEGRYLSAAELGRLLDRDPIRLRRTYLSPMVREGVLRTRYPEATNRPDQAYTLATPR